MIPYCHGKAVIEQFGTGQQFEIESDLIDFQIVGSDIVPSSSVIYEAKINHEDLGVLSWTIIKYPNLITTDFNVGPHHLVQDFDYGLMNENEFFFGDDYLTISPQDFAELTEEEQIDMMIGWFNHMFEDPQMETPYAIDKESPYNYKYIWGGPYYVPEELQTIFEGIASDEAIKKATKLIQQDGIFEWAPSNNHPTRFNDEDELAEQFNDDLTLEDIRQRLNENPALTIGTEQETKARSEIFESADKLRLLMKCTDGETTHGGIGHNQPPAKFEIPSDLKVKIDLNINIIVTQAKETEPDVKATTESIGILQDVMNELKGFIKETKDQVISKGSKALALAIVSCLGILIYKGISWLSLLLGFGLV